MAFSGFTVSQDAPRECGGRGEDDVSAKVAALDRARLGNRLHDDLLQMVTGIALQAKTLEKLAERGDGICAKEAAEIGRTASNLSRKMRGLVSELSGSLLQAGLRSAIRNLALDLAGVHGATVRLDLRELPFVGPIAAFRLYGMMREAITSALRQREAKELIVSARTFGSRLAVRIGDNGMALDEERCRVAVASITEYLRLGAMELQAACRMRPRAAGGASIIILTPYHPDIKPESSS